MIGLISKLFGGNKSQKDVKVILPIVEKVNTFYKQYRELSNDHLRAKTQEFKSRIQEHLETINGAIENQKQEAEALPIEDITGRDSIYQLIDKLKKDRDEQIEEALKAITPEAFAVVKETARRFTENK